MNEIGALIGREPRELSHHHMRILQEGVIPEPGNGPSLGIESAITVILDVPTPRTVRN